ncbi:unnamed protein product [Gongylonema pulchrum]|uniref:Plexin_cytopl domain-containing protein n=1 Tax=Gongylonema pulchrum TaxID=637853 RepID=A0A183DQ35_9BILA|nr:unnamed protein product [Gongylonema pulchrum]
MRCFFFQLRLVSLNTSCSALILRFLRSNYDLIYRLVLSPLFLNTDEYTEEEENVVLKNLKVTAQGLVLELSAIEISSLLQSHYYSQCKCYFHVMLSQKGEAAMEQEDSVDNLATSTVATSERIDFDYTPSGQTNEEEWPLLWRLLKVKTNVKEMDMPVMEMISAKKLQKILSLCIRPTSANVQQCDIEHLNWLLHRESIVVANEMQPEFCSVISKESKQLLRYCVNYNLSKNAEASMRQLVSGWLSFVNVFAIFAPDMEDDIGVFRTVISELVDVLIQFLTQPSRRSLQTKLDLYACISYILSCSTEPFDTEETTKGATQLSRDFFFGMARVKIAQQDLLRASFTKYGHELISVVSNDICDSPHELRVSFVSKSD